MFNSNISQNNNICLSPFLPPPDASQISSTSFQLVSESGTDIASHHQFNSKAISRDSEVASRNNNPGGQLLTKEPFFDSTPPKNVSALIGKTAFLTCVVKNLGKAKSVSQLVSHTRKCHEKNAPYILFKGSFCVILFV